MSAPPKLMPARVSKHAAGRIVAKGAAAARRKRQRAAKAARKRNRSAH